MNWILWALALLLGIRAIFSIKLIRVGQAGKGGPFLIPWIVLGSSVLMAALLVAAGAIPALSPTLLGSVVLLAISERVSGRLIARRNHVGE
jgi:hypothetical protein